MSKRSSITSDQKEALVEFMENHPDLRKGKLSINVTTAIAKTQWEDCCKLLNSIPGPAKNMVEYDSLYTTVKFSLVNERNVFVEEPHPRDTMARI